MCEKILSQTFFHCLLIHDLTTSCNNVQHDAEKMKVLITIVMALLFPNLKLVLC